VIKLYPYQEEGVKKIEKFNGIALLADDMGLGKTAQALKYIYDHPELRPVIIVCPATLKWVWETQAHQHYGLRATVLSGRKKPKTGLREQIPILIINYDILDAWKDYLIGLNPKIVVADEAHYIKTSNTRRTKALKALCKNVPHKIAISGTPLTNRPAELFSTLNILWPKEFHAFTPFAHRHCAPKWKPWGWDFRGASHLDELHAKLKKLGMIRRLKKDVLKFLPKKTNIVIPIEIQNRTEYNKALHDFINWLGEKSPSKASRASKAEELVKIGYLVRLAAALKMNSVFEWIDNFFEQSDDKLVAFCCHKKIVEMLRTRYKDKCVIITGATSQKKRKLAVENFQKNPKIKLFIGNIRAAGTGIDLFAANTCVFIETGFVPGDVSQASDRLHRIGQKKNVFIYFLTAINTIEESLCKILQAKQNTITHVLDGKRKRKEIKFDIYKQLLKTIGRVKK